MIAVALGSKIGFYNPNPDRWISGKSGRWDVSLYESPGFYDGNFHNA